MDKTIYEARTTVTFENPFPYVGEVLEIIKEDRSEWVIRILEVSNFDWKIENGQVVGVLVNVKYRFIEEVRPSSKGKLRLL